MRDPQVERSVPPFDTRSIVTTGRFQPLRLCQIGRASTVHNIQRHNEDDRLPLFSVRNQIEESELLATNMCAGHDLIEYYTASDNRIRLRSLLREGAVWQTQRAKRQRKH